MVERMHKGEGFTEIKWIPVKNLSVIWVAAQRPLNEKHAKSIAEEFDPEKIGTLAVTKPNGQGIYHIIDGQHRKAAIEMRWGKDEMAPCNVFDAVDPQKAAKLFASLNTRRRPPTPLDLFKVNVTAGEKTQVAVSEIMRKCDYRLAGKGGTHAAGTISCVGAMEFVYLSYGPVVLEAVLRTIRAIWGPEDKTALSAYIVRGLGVLLSEFRHIDHKKLIEATAAKYTSARLIGAAKAAKENFGGNIQNSICEVLMRAYNEKVRGKNKLVRNKKGK